MSDGQCELTIANQTGEHLNYDSRVTGDDGGEVLAVAEQIPHDETATFEFSFESIDAATILLDLDLADIALRLDGSADHAQWDVNDGNIVAEMADTPSYLTYALTVQHDGTVSVSLEAGRQAV